jgi:hypothetical protein
MEEYKEETPEEELSEILKCIKFSAQRVREGATRPELSFVEYDILKKRRAV